MDINNLVSIIKRADKTYEMQMRHKTVDAQQTWGIALEELEELYNLISTSKDRNQAFTDFLAQKRVNPAQVADALDEQGQLELAMQKLIDFFTEFQFTPSYRFINTLGIKLSKSIPAARNYILNYFKLIDSPYARDLVDKMKSVEFIFILNKLKNAKPTQCINNRLMIYYGAQGTGKTTEALKLANNKCIVCNSGILPNDLIEDFTFSDGKAQFVKSAFTRAIEEGETIVLDELNLLPFDTIRFLQGLLDGKKSFTYKGHTIQIHDNFKIIATMNLVVNGVCYGLPEPLVDRASDLREFEISAKDLLGAL